MCQMNVSAFEHLETFISTTVISVSLRNVIADVFRLEVFSGRQQFFNKLQLIVPSHPNLSFVKTSVLRQLSKKCEAENRLYRRFYRAKLTSCLFVDRSC